MYSIIPNRVLGLERGKSTSSNMYEDNLLPIEWIGIVESNFITLI